VIDPDDALWQAWSLTEDAAPADTPEGLDALLPSLEEAGYVELTDTEWRFTPEGVARAQELREEKRLTETVPWPFEDDTFPARLGVAVMHTVLNGEMPALQVVHAAEDWWGVADGVNSPNGHASTTAHMQHVLELDPTLAELATLAPGFQADRDDVESPWVVSPFAWGDD